MKIQQDSMLSLKNQVALNKQDNKNCRRSDLNGTQLVAGSTYTYDAKNRLNNLTHSNATSAVAFYNFEYDSADRIAQISDVDGTTDYNYDLTNQLTGANHTDVDNPDESYSYDANGNRLTSHKHGSGYVRGGNNRLESDGRYSFQYDGEGNLMRRTEIATNKVTEYTWDYRNRLVEVTDKSAAGTPVQKVAFTYDAMDRRLSKTVDANPLDTVGGAVTHFVYDRENVLLEFVDGDGVAGANPPVLSRRYLFGNGVDQVLAQEDGTGGNVTWALTDYLGSVKDLVNNSTAIVHHISYDSFGNVANQTNAALGSRYRFTGREFDTETGLYYYRARYYDAAVGRFIGPDPIGFESGDVNLYRYVGNRPTDSLDPSGLSSRNLRILLNLARGGTNPRVYTGYPESPNYAAALATATTWFRLITIPNSRTSRFFPPGGVVNWVQTAMLRDDNDPQGRGRANLRPNSATPPLQVPTIDLVPDNVGRGRTHDTPGHPQVREVKFRFAGPRNPSPACPAAIPTNEPRLEDGLENYRRLRPPTPAPVPAPAPTPVPAPAPVPVIPLPAPSGPNPLLEILKWIFGQPGREM